MYALSIEKINVSLDSVNTRSTSIKAETTIIRGILTVHLSLLDKQSVKTKYKVSLIIKLQIKIGFIE